MQTGKYSKFLVAVLGTVSIAVQTFTPHASWAPLATAIAAAVTVYLVPNTQPAPQADPEATGPMPAITADPPSTWEDTPFTPPGHLPP